MDITPGGICFVIFSPLKHARRVVKPKVVECPNTDVPALNVSDYVISYLNRTLPLRASIVKQGKPKPTQFFLSWATKKPVSKPTLSQWLKIVLSNSGIDTTQFSGHSFRGAGLSHAHEKGASIERIVQAGCWSNVSTFKTHYLAPRQDSSVGRIILSKV